MNKHTLPTAAPTGPLPVSRAAIGQPVGAGLSTFDLGAGDYVMRADDFPDGCFVRTINGLRFGTGENQLGVEVTLPLDVPLCGGCDAPLDAGVCADCGIVFVECLKSGGIAL